MGGDYTRRLYTFSAKEETICTEEGGGDYLGGRTTVYTYICRLYKFSTKEGTMHRGDYL